LGRIRAREGDIGLSRNPNPLADVGGAGGRLPFLEPQPLQTYHDADHSGGSHVMEEDGAGAGAVENQGMETEQPSDPSHLGDAQGLMASQLGGNHLTLFFQRGVFVFDSVSPEKVTSTNSYLIHFFQIYREKQSSEKRFSFLADSRRAFVAGRP
ncbi:hypothetical protein BHM03_00014680, partial [Ensete ventricosum]